MSKIVKNKSENLKKSEKITFFSKIQIFSKTFVTVKKKFYLFLNIRNTGFDQSSPVQPNPEKIWKTLEKSQKITYF